MRIVTAVLLASTVGCVYLSTASHPATSNAPNAAPATTAPPGPTARWVTKTPPPPAYAETPPPNANASAVWLPGYFKWDGKGFEWFPGHWAKPPAGTHEWVPGEWTERSDGTWQFVDGHWQ